MKDIFSRDDIKQTIKCIGTSKDGDAALCKKFVKLLKEMDDDNINEVEIEAEHPFAKPRVMPWMQKTQ